MLNKYLVAIYDTTVDQILARK